MRSHFEEHNIDFFYKDFKRELSNFESDMRTFISDFHKAVKNNSVENWNSINKKVLSKYLINK